MFVALVLVSPHVLVAQYFSDSEPKLLTIGEYGFWRSVMARTATGEILCTQGTEDLEDGSRLVFGRYANSDFFSVSIIYDEENAFSERPLEFELQIDSNEPIHLQGELSPGHLVADIGLDDVANPGVRVKLLTQMTYGKIIRTLDRNNTEINSWQLDGFAPSMVQSAQCLMFFE
jgi:hypothetical protein